MCVIGTNFAAHLRRWIDKIVHFVVHVNLFATVSQDVEKVHRQRITTRVFIVSLLICLAVLSFYQWIAIQAKTVAVPSPTQTQYDQLYANHRATLRCPCSQPFIPYSTFIEIAARLHQVCSSELISSTWYTHLALINTTTPLSSSGFWPTFGSSYFQLLASFCSLVQTTINDSYRVFSVNVYTNDQVVPRNVLLAQVQEFSDLYIKSVEVETTRSFSFIRDTTQINQFITEKGDNFKMFVYFNGEVQMQGGSWGVPNPSNPNEMIAGCLCISSGLHCGFYPFLLTNDNNPIFVTSLIMQCFPSESVLLSTLECWYDLNCVALVRNSCTRIGVPDVIDISLLDNTIHSRFPINATIERIMQGLFLENWTVSFSYDRYYNTCAPISCTYTIEQQFDLFLVLVTAVAVYGGLSKGLRLLIPLLVSLFRLFLVSTPFRVATIRKHVLEFNVYDNPTSTERTRPQERLNTRVYIALLVGSAVVIVFYAGLIQHSEKRILSSPSQSTFEKLFLQYSDTLQCPCSTVSIVQQDFISHLNVSLHPVCSSALGSEEWSTYLAGNPFLSAGAYLLEEDFRQWGLPLFKTLTSLCSMANETLTIAIAQYQARRFISNQLLPEAQFQAETDARLQQFQLATSTIFRSIVGPIRAAAQGNALITVLKTNWIPKVDYFDIDVPLLTVPVVYSDRNCSCATSSSCSQPAKLFGDDWAPYYTVSDIFHGCTPLDSLLMSSLSCFISATCLESFLNAIPLTATGLLYSAQPYSMPPLNFSSNRTRFRTNDTFEIIINALFIDLWSSEISYPHYFDACQPLHCTYLFTRRLDIVRVATIFLSVFGGLSTILRFGTPRLIRIVKRFFLRRTQS